MSFCLGVVYFGLICCLVFIWVFFRSVLVCFLWPWGRTFCKELKGRIRFVCWVFWLRIVWVLRWIGNTLVHHKKVFCPFPRRTWVVWRGLIWSSRQFHYWTKQRRFIKTFSQWRVWIDLYRILTQTHSHSFSRAVWVFKLSEMKWKLRCVLFLSEKN